MLKYLHSTIIFPDDRILLSRRVPPDGAAPGKWNATSAMTVSDYDDVDICARLNAMQEFGIRREMFERGEAREGFYGTLNIDAPTERSIILHTIRILSMLKFSTKPENAFKLIEAEQLISHVDNNTPECNEYTGVLKATVKEFKSRGVI